MITRSAKNVKYMIIKTVSEEVVNSTTLQNDNELAVILGRNRTYQITIHLSVRSPGADTPNIKLAWTMDGTLSSDYVFNIGPGATVSTDETAENVQIRRTSPSYETVFGVLNSQAGCIVQTFIITTGASSGSLHLQWAQNTANANGTDVEAGSFMEIEEVKLL